MLFKYPKMETTYNSAYRLPKTSTQTVGEDEFKASASSVSNFAYKEDTNYRFRPSMEDGHKAVDSFMGDPNSGFFAIFDGHGGKEAVDYCKSRMDIEFQKALQETGRNVEQALRRCFTKVDDQLRLAGAINSGTTATVAFIRREMQHKVLYVANVGDSKAVITTHRDVQVLTYDHRGSDASEIDRIV